ncbi:MAG TPA: hypothetical protein DDW65_08600 [Firmicutes bacterium]|jgi:hypothetical protein|nr:hypothetical protein [Bacillota bacterium]
MGNIAKTIGKNNDPVCSEPNHPHYKQLKNMWLNMDGVLLNNLMNPNIPWFMKAIIAGRFVVRRRYSQRDGFFYGRRRSLKARDNE